jgi:Predicted signal transduction protein with a C-terminal ATPase domain
MRLFKRNAPIGPHRLRTELVLSFVAVMLGTLLLVEGISIGRIGDLIGRRVSESTVETLKQIDKNLAFLFGDIEDISLFTISNRFARAYLKLDPSDRARAQGLLIDLNEEFANLANSKLYVADVSIRGLNGLSFDTMGPSSAEDEASLSAIEASLPRDGSWVLTPTYLRRYSNLGPRRVLSYCRRIKDINALSRDLGVLRVDVDERRIGEIYGDVRLGRTGYIFIAGKDGVVLSHPDKSRISSRVGGESYLSGAFAGGEGFRRERIAGKDTLVTYYTSPRYDFVIIGLTPFGELLGELAAVRDALLLAILLSLLPATALFFAVASRVTGPVVALTALMKRVEGGELEVVADVRRSDEVGELGRGFNSMIAEIRRLIDEVYESRLRSKEAQLRALQAQINPHFLYNTLDVIYWTSRLEKAPKTGELVVALSSLFKLGLNGGSELTTVGKEVEHLESYLAIQKVRYDDPPRIEVSIAPELYGCGTIKLILQPIVENALVHGIANLGAEGSVSVTGRAEGGDIVFEVADNGVGMDERCLAALLEEEGERDGMRGYGVKNVRDRIRLRFGEAYGLSVSSFPGAGTRVTMRIPRLGPEGETRP